MNKDARIYIAGHRGLVGSNVVKSLKDKGFTNLVLRTRDELDLLNQQQVEDFFRAEQIDYAIIAAAKVGGILYNKNYQADFLYENIMIAANTIKAAHDNGVEKLLFLGSSCIYPKLSQQPIKEDYLLTGTLEPTNEGYAIAKIAGLKLCEKFQEQYGSRFISAMPTNLYGPGDNFHPENSHVIPALMRRFHEAKIANASTVTIWGSGEPRREFLHVEDLAEALYVVLSEYEEPTTINIGTGEDCRIIELAEMMKDVVGYKGEVLLDPTKPDGTPRKVLDVSKVRSLGWSPRYDLRAGLESTYRWAVDSAVF